MALYTLDEKSMVIIPQFVGVGDNNGSGDYIKNTIYQYLSNVYDANNLKIDIDESADFDTKLVMALNNLPVGLHCIIVIDGINQLSTEESKDFLKWIRQELSPFIKVVFSSTPDDIYTKALLAHGVDVVDVDEMTSAEKDEFITSYLSCRGKSLNDDLITRITNAPLFGNSLALRILLDTIIVFSNHESLESDLESFLASDSLSEFFQRIFEKIDSEFNSATIKNILSFIYVSNQGLLENEIINLCNIIPLEWSQIRRLLKFCFVEEKGKYKLSHSQIANAVWTRYFDCDISTENNYCSQLVSFFECEHSERAYAELPFLYLKLNRLDSLYHYILKCEVAEYFLNHNPSAFKRFWTNIRQYNPTYKLTDYIDSIGIGSSDLYRSLGRFCNEYLSDTDSAQQIFEVNLSQTKKAGVDFLKDIREVLEEGGIDGYLEEAPDHLQFSGSFCDMGHIAYDKGDYKEALSYYHKALGFVSDSNEFFNFDVLETKSQRIQLFVPRDDEYHRVAYALHCLGKTYDELSEERIACLMYSRAEQYLLICENPSKALLGELYHNWAISEKNTDPQQAINHLKHAIKIRKAIDDDIVPSMNALGVIYEDKFEMHAEAINLYNQCIEIKNTLGRRDSSLGEVYLNKANAEEDFDEKIDNIKEALAIFQDDQSVEDVMSAYKNMADIYYNNQNYQKSAYYYLICYNLSRTLNGVYDEQTRFFVKEVSDALARYLLYKGKGLNDNNFDYKSLMFDYKSLMLSYLFFSYQEDTQLSLESLIEMQVYDLYKDVLIDELPDKHFESYWRVWVILNDILGFYTQNGRLPVMDEELLNCLLLLALQEGNLSPIFNKLMDNIKPQDWYGYKCTSLVKWKGICCALYQKKLSGYVAPEELFKTVKFADINNVIEAVTTNKEDPAFLYFTDTLNSFIYDIYIPNNRLDYAEATIDLILKLCPDEYIYNYLDSKAEISFRLGKIAEAVDLVKKVNSIDNTFYPAGNEFLYNNLRQYF